MNKNRKFKDKYISEEDFHLLMVSIKKRLLEYKEEASSRKLVNILYFLYKLVVKPRSVVQN